MEEGLVLKYLFEKKREGEKHQFSIFVSKVSLLIKQKIKKYPNSHKTSLKIINFKKGILLFFIEKKKSL